MPVGVTVRGRDDVGGSWDVSVMFPMFQDWQRRRWNRWKWVRRWKGWVRSRRSPFRVVAVVEKQKLTGTSDADTY